MVDLQSKAAFTSISPYRNVMSQIGDMVVIVYLKHIDVGAIWLAHFKLTVRLLPAISKNKRLHIVCQATLQDTSIQDSTR